MELTTSNIIEWDVDYDEDEDLFAYDFMEDMNLFPMNSEQKSLPSVRKRRQSKPRRNQSLAIPRVVKHDVRRHYSRMLTNIWNSHDPQLFQSFLRTYSIPHVRSRHMGIYLPPVKLLSSTYSAPFPHNHHATITPSSSPLSTMSVSAEPTLDWSTQGINIFAKWMGYVQQLVPDQTMTIATTQIHSNSQWNGSSVVTFRIANNLTRMFDLEPTELARLMEDMVFYDCDVVNNVIVDKELLCRHSLDTVQDTVQDTATCDTTCDTRCGTATTKRVFESVVPACASFHMPDLSQQFCDTFGRPPKVFSSGEKLTVMIDVSLYVNERRQIEAITFTRN